MAQKTPSVADTLKAANAALKAGERQHAATLYQSVLQRFPGNAKAQAGLKKSGPVDATPKQSLFAVPQTPQKTIASLGQLSDIEDPIEAAKRAMRGMPVMEKTNDLMAATSGSYQSKLRIKETEDEFAGKSAEELVQMAHDALNSAQPNRAIKLFTRLHELVPENCDFLNGLGLATRAAGRLDDALEIFDKTLAIDPGFLSGYSNKGLVYTDREEYEQAMAAFAKAFEIDPDYALARRNMGLLHMQRGEMAEAEACFYKAIDADPDLGASYLDLSTARKFKEGDPLIPKMVEILKNKDLSDGEQIPMCFALGKVFGDVGDTENAFRYLSQGNALVKKVRNYTIATDRLRFELIKLQFKAAKPLELSPQEASSHTVKPIFIVGMPRTGSTLIEQVLSSHSKVYGGGELGFLNPTINAILRKAALTPEQGYDKALLQRVRDSYLKKAEGLAAPSEYMTDKNLLNFRFIGYILASMPEAVVIDLQRDPMATCWSMFKHRFLGSGLSFTFDLDDIAEYYKMYKDMMAFWHRKYPGRIVSVNYDAFTQDQEGETRKLLKNCGLTFEQGCIDFHKNKRAIKTASVTQVRKKVYKGSNEEWRRFERFLEPLKEKLGV